MRALRWGGSSLLATALVLLVAVSWRWPLTNDAILIHYVVLLQQHGLAPYAGVHDINFPGAYLPDWLALRYTGVGHRLNADLCWRLYDLALSAVALGAMVVIALPVDWFAGVFAGSLLVLFHGRDGIGQLGQRDYAIAVLLMFSCAAVLVAFRRLARAAPTGPPAVEARTALLFVVAGMALGAATTIKPFGLLFLLLYLGWVVSERGWRNSETRAGMLLLLSGFAMPIAAALVFLVRHHALISFLYTCRVMLPFHASISSPTLLGLVNGTQRSISRLAILALVLAVVQKSWRNRLARFLFAGFLLGTVCFWMQHKGYPYQRYPYMPFLLLWVALECTATLRQSGTILRLLGTAGILYGVLSAAPACLRVAMQAHWDELYLAPMEQDLRKVAGSPGIASLDGRVQCIDTISGCISFLYRVHLTQATGTLYDEFLFPPLAASGAVPPVVAQAQQQFLDELRKNPPEVIIVSPWLFTEGPGKYEKLKRWPAFEQMLGRYSLLDERSFPRTQNGPLGFRMYVRRHESAAPAVLP